MMILTVPCYYIVYENAQVDLINISLYFVACLYYIGFILQFSSAAVAVRDRFAMVNCNFERKKHLSFFEIQMHIELYQKLLEIISHINEFLTFPLISIFACLLHLETIFIYTFIRAMLLQTQHQIFLMITQFCWIFSYLYLMMIASYVSESLLKDCQKFKEISYEILRTSQISQNSRENLKIFLSSISNSKFKLKTIFFDIDWKFLLQVSH